ncbi:FecR family protein [Aestuariivivens insulae]|uniref:FecR family protein n=1 Tax=Aestuariivivens insulae TaxID=1621988 RepID=UPI001F5625C4|nr:FecR family protein [Aestuariivivens insulae]
MISPKIQKIIIKYFTKQASFSDMETLEAWLENPDHVEEFKNYVEVNYAIDFNIQTFNEELSNKRLLEYINKDKRVYRLRKVKHVLKYAAIVIVLLGTGFMYQKGYFTAKQEPIIPEESITLQLDNGNIEVIKEDGSTQIVDKEGTVIGQQKGNQLTYSNNITEDKLVYNTLTVPYGKRFEVKLSDGTNVHLNAGTSLKYPVKFIKGEKTRQVFLDGEAYFDVSKDIDHPFIVHADNLNIQVFGTEFNVTAYPEDAATDVVLVEGSVGLYTDEESLKENTTITPGTKGSFDKGLYKITTEAVDTDLYTAWMQGGLMFRNMPFKNITKKLERYYNVNIIITDRELNDEIFYANFNEEPLENVLSYFSDSYDLEYNIKGNTIFIN